MRATQLVLRAESRFAEIMSLKNAKVCRCHLGGPHSRAMTPERGTAPEEKN
jgi:hypothetical protein